MSDFVQVAGKKIDQAEDLKAFYFNAYKSLQLYAF